MIRNGGRVARWGAAAALMLTAIAAGGAAVAPAQDALRGKLLYHDIGRVNGVEASCVDCHGGVPGALHGLGKVADNPAAVAYALEAVPQMAVLRGRVSSTDMADIAAYVANPAVPAPQISIAAEGAAASPYSADRLEFSPLRPGEQSPASRIVFSNTGRVPLAVVFDRLLAGADAAQFAIVEDDCAARTVLAPTESCSVSVAFRPQGGEGLRSASVGLAHAWIGGGTRVALIGRVGRPE